MGAPASETPGSATGIECVDGHEPRPGNRIADGTTTPAGLLLIHGAGHSLDPIRALFSQVRRTNHSSVSASQRRCRLDPPPQEIRAMPIGSLHPRLDTPPRRALRAITPVAAREEPTPRRRRSTSLLPAILAGALALPSGGDAARLRSDALASLGGGLSGAESRGGMTVGLPVAGRSLAAGGVELAGFWRPARPGAAAVLDPGVPGSILPATTGIDRVGPNPTRGPLSIRYRIASSVAAPDPARIEIYDLLGRRLFRSVELPPVAGHHAAYWDGLDDRGRPLSTGRYYLRFTAGDHREIRPITVLR